MEDNEIAVAQAEQPEAPISEPIAEVAPTPEPQTVPIQRVNEITAARREAERRAEELQQQTLQQSAQIAVLIQQMEASNSRRNAEQAAPVPEMEPEFKRALDAYMEPLVNNQRQRDAEFRAFLEHQQFEAESAGFDAETKAEAKRLQQSWAKAGATGWVAKDALVYAAGQRALAAQQQVSAAKSQSADFNNLSKTVQSAQAATVPATSKKTNLDGLPAQRRMEIMEAEMDDFPL